MALWPRANQSHPETQIDETVAKNRTVIIIPHRPPAIRGENRVILMDQGRVVERERTPR